MAKQIREDFLATYWNKDIGFFTTYKLPGSSWCQAVDGRMVPGEKESIPAKTPTRER